MMMKHHLERLLSESEPASEVCSHGLQARLLTLWRQYCQHCDDYDVVGDDDDDYDCGGDRGGGGDDKAWERNAVEEEEG